MSPAEQAARHQPVVIVSMEPWGDMWYSKQHYAAQLASEREVYFVSLPDRWRWKDLFSFTASLRETPEGVRVLEYRNNFPLRLLGRRLASLMNLLNALKVSRIMPARGYVIWSFFPTSLAKHLAGRNSRSKVIYHVVDPYIDRPNDRSFARQADLVVAINPWYLRYYGRINDRCLLVPHGMQAASRTSDPKAVHQHRQRYGRFAVLASGLSRSLNFPLLLQLARTRPDVPLVIAGKRFPLPKREQELSNALFSLPNVHYAGVLHPERLKDLIRAASLSLVTYAFEETRSVPGEAGRTPLKALTYLAQHCPVVSTNNSYVPEVEGRGFFKAEDPDHFLALANEVLEGKRGVDDAAIDAYLDTVGYGALSQRILHALDEPVKAHDSDKPMVPRGSPVLIISNEAWDGPRYSKHRTAIALAASRSVVFVDPAMRWQPMNLLRWSISERRTPEGVDVISYFNAIPYLGGSLRGLNDRVVSLRLRRYLRRTGRYAPLIWTFDPSRLASPALLNPVLSVYHCADDHSLGVHVESKLAGRVDHVFCIAKGLMPRFLGVNPSVHHVPHGLAQEDLEPATASHPRFPSGYGLYIGNVNNRHDFLLWEKLMRAHADLHWVVVGPVRATDSEARHLQVVKRLPNVTFTGQVPYGDLRALISGCAFGFLYMNDDLEANRISSQKVVQFLAQGKPFFCSWLSEYAGHRDLVLMSDSHAEALELFARWRAEGETGACIERRIAHARELLYERLFERLPFRL